MADAIDRVRTRGNFVVPEIPLGTWDELGSQQSDDALAPLIFNAWYVIALDKDVDRSLKRISVLGQPLVYYRREDGTPAVLDDRCAHRRYPLSNGKLVGDKIQCGYHGFTYASSERCVWAPGLPANRPDEELAFGVRAYPSHVRGPWLWVWMGKSDKADPKNIPLPEVELAPENTIFGYKMNPSNYMLVIENLLDLSHLCFLHGAADLAHVAVVPKEEPTPRDAVGWSKRVECTETGIVGAECGDDPSRLVCLEDSVTQFGPSLSFGYQKRFALPGEAEAPRPGVLTVGHALTPSDHRNTHQFFMIAMSDPPAKTLDAMLYGVEEIVFEQDVEAVRAMQAYIEQDTRAGRVEFSMAYDSFGIKMRRILREMKQRELDE